MEVSDFLIFMVAVSCGVLALILRLVFKRLFPRHAEAFQAQSSAAAAGQAGTAAAPQPEAPAHSRWLRALWAFKEWMEVGFTAVLLAFLIRSFVVQAFKIPSSSMENTLLIGDHLIVNKFIFGVQIPFTDKFVVRFRPPHHDEIFVFRYPKDPSRDFIKRCVGLPGDVIELKNKILYRNGQALDEPYVVHKGPLSIRMDDPYISPEEKLIFNYGPVTVPADCFFAMGDNRDFSSDSRFWGFVPYDNLRGTPLVIYWPPNRIRIVP